MAMTITSEIWQVGGDGFTSAQDAAIYLICFDGRAAIVDAGCGGRADQLEANILGCGVSPEQVDYLLLTHCHFDHAGGAEEVRTRFKCAIVAHEEDAGALETGNSLLTAANWYGTTLRPLTVDIKLSGSRNRIVLGTRQVTAIHTPGHTPGSVVYLVESDGQQVLFGQDVHGPLHDDFGSDRRAYQQSLLNMIELGADILCEGHFGVFLGADKVRDFIRSFC
jgi:glyoxylase-like metal-dependent hydrolase (beta-lactamase superfamily II)